MNQEQDDTHGVLAILIFLVMLFFTMFILLKWRGWF